MYNLNEYILRILFFLFKLLLLLPRFPRGIRNVPYRWKGIGGNGGRGGREFEKRRVIMRTYRIRDRCGARARVVKPNGGI